MAPLICSVRNCGRPLARSGRSFRCEASHSFDLARSGYLNLLQPNDRRSSNAGDSKASVEARIRFLEHYGDPFVADYAKCLGGRADVILDAGCGFGYQLDALRALLGSAEAYGVDLSIPAIERAARTFPHCFFIVANADRFLPLQEASMDAIFSITARRNPVEFARLLHGEGTVVIAVPGGDDLAQLREEIHDGGAQSRSRIGKVIAEHAELFDVIDRHSLKREMELDHEGIRNILASTYRGFRHSERDRLQRIDRAVVTMSRDVVVLRKRR